MANSKSYRRVCGVIKGDLHDINPFIYIFKDGNCGRAYRSPSNQQALQGIFGVNHAAYDGMFMRRGVILPLSRCSDEKVKAVLMNLKGCVSHESVSDGAEIRRSQANLVLQSGRLHKQIRLAEHAHLDGYVEFANNREFFALLADSFEYLTEVMDHPYLRVRPLAFQKPPFRSYGEFLEWFYEREKPRRDWGWEHCKVALVFNGTGSFDPFFAWGINVEYPEINLFKNFDIKHGEPGQPVAIRLHQEEWGGLFLTINIGDEEKSVYLSDTWPPLENLVVWLKSVARGELPVQFVIDEEGPDTRLSAYPTGDPARILFHIANPYGGDERINAIVLRSDFVETFRRAIGEFFSGSFNPESWYGFDVPKPHIGEIINSDPWFGQQVANTQPAGT